jgi:hypothetical protein
MSLSRARLRSAEEQPAERDPKQCSAYGCPCRATVNVGGNGWACTFHGFAEVDKWQDITRGIREHDWLLGLVSDVQRMDRQNQNWRAFATQFWVNSDEHCIPHPKENAAPYCERMIYELLWRIGQRKGRPVARIPQPVKPSGRFARFQEDA